MDDKFESHEEIIERVIEMALLTTYDKAPIGELVEQIREVHKEAMRYIMSEEKFNQIHTRVREKIMGQIPKPFPKIVW